MSPSPTSGFHSYSTSCCLPYVILWFSYFLLVPIIRRGSMKNLHRHTQTWLIFHLQPRPSDPRNITLYPVQGLGIYAPSSHRNFLRRLKGIKVLLMAIMKADKHIYYPLTALKLACIDCILHGRKSYGRQEERESDQLLVFPKNRNSVRHLGCDCDGTDHSVLIQWTATHCALYGKRNVVKGSQGR